MLKGREALFVSIFALVVSIIGTYLSFRVVHDANVRVVDFNVNFHGEDQEAVTKLIFYNNGNAPYLVTDIQLIVGQDKSGEGYFMPDDGAPKDGTLPFVLDKGQMKLVEVKRRAASAAKDVKGSEIIYYGLKLSSMDIEGETHDSIIWHALICRSDGRVFSAQSNSRAISVSTKTTEVFEGVRKEPCSDL